MLIIQGNQVRARYQAEYQDSNNNLIMDQGDQGWFAPGSTVKVAIALAIIEKLGTRNSIENDLIRMLVLSDNLSTNRLIDLLGGTTELTKTLRLRGFEHLIVGRK